MSDNRNEKILVFVFAFILIISIGAIVYTISSSNSSLYNNTSASPNSGSSSSQSGNNGNSSGGLTEEQIDNMNVDNPNQNPTTPVPQPVETEIATYTTNIYDKDDNRVHNISLAISKLNNTVIKSGGEFSFNNTIGPMGAGQGFKEAIGFDTNGNKIKMLGGGLCQISSTLYNSALISNMEITERHPHSRRVYYVPIDKDATIYYGHLDLKFKNNTGSDVKIVATNDNTSVVIKLMKISTGA